MTDDRKISALLHLETAGVRLPDELRDRIKREAAQPVQRKRRWLGITVAGLVASVVLLAALPGPRAAATNVLHQVFQRGGVKFVVNSGTQPAPEAPPPKQLVPLPDDAYNRFFYSETGPLRPDGVAAVKRLADQFRLPAWVPEGMPKRLQMPHEGWDGGTFKTYYWLGIGNEMSVGAKFPSYGVLGFQGGDTKVDAKPVMLAGAEGLEVKVGNQIRYYVTVDNVAYTFSGPLSQEAVLRKIAESLAPANH